MSGTRLRGRHVGAEGDVSVFSFHAVKNLPTADSGMICFPDAESDAAARHWTWLGIDKDTFARTQSDSTYKWHYQVEHVGFKYHGNSIMAGIGLVSLQYLDADNAFRRQLAAWYDEGLAGAAGIDRVPVAPECESARHLYQVMVDRRDEVMVGLNAAQIYPGRALSRQHGVRDVRRPAARARAPGAPASGSFLCRCTCSWIAPT